jgi:hypothetical protein
MKSAIRIFGLCFSLIASSLNARAQGTFQNLDFESTVLVPVPGDIYGRVQFAPAFPGWSGMNGTDVETLALYNSMFLDSTGIGIHGQGSPQTFGPTRISGNYTAMIQSGRSLSSSLTPTIASLSQTALVPANTASLQFKAIAYGPFEISLNDVPLSLTPVQANAGYTLYGVNIPTYAGMTAKLTITVLHRPSPAIISSLFVDDILFSTQPIPEPGVGTILVLGLVAVVSSRSRGIK